MPKATTNNIELEYKIWGDDSAPPLLLIGGLGVQILSWTELFVKALVDRGFRVIAYDNRDIGMSTKFDDWGPADIKAAFTQARAKEKVKAPYNLEDMADDAAGLLNFLSIDQALVVGNSNGGAIAQTFAIRHPAKTKTLISMMATSGRRGLPRPEGAVAEWLSSPRNPSGTREAAMDEAVSTSQIIGSPGFPRENLLFEKKRACFSTAVFIQQVIVAICWRVLRPPITAWKASAILPRRPLSFTAGKTRWCLWHAPKMFRKLSLALK